ncbi:hypothetical protein BJV82DRAFT_562056 [Fennellomyces sp. T-0311]|nr:hypothetical protein BJV82DRAFT_562056 [Fennellomyces sp. T-0311]
MYYCKNDACKHLKPYITLRGLMAHVRCCHSNSPMGSDAGFQSAAPQISSEHSSSQIDTYIDMDYDYGHGTADNNMLTAQNNAADTQNCPTALHEEIVGFKAEPYGIVPGNDSQDLCLSELEYRIASYATENELSKSSYTGLISLIGSVIEHCPGASTQPDISIQSIESLNYKISLGNKSRYSIPFKTVEIDPADIDGFPERHIEEFRREAGKIFFSYRDIIALCELLFSYRPFWDHTILNAAIVTRDGERVYTDIYSGNWWENGQRKLPKGDVLLAIMLASDQADVSANGREKAWPLYLKLGNTPKAIRNKDKEKASRVLAYFPVIKKSARYGNLEWYRTARKAAFHHCLRIVLGPLANNGNEIKSIFLRGPHNKIYKCVPMLACYTADLPEQRLLSLTMSGNAAMSCPRCFEQTSNFKDLPANTILLRSTKLMKDMFQHALALENNNQQADAYNMRRTYSMSTVKNAFWEIPGFDIYRSLLVDDLHQLGGVYEHLVNCIEQSIKEKRNGVRLIRRVDERASQLPPYRKLRQFHNGFFLSNLRNVAYAELKDHMAILLVVIHDLVDPQFIISMRYFIDFYFSATSKEHTDASLQIVQDSLEDFQKYSAIFAKYSKSGLAFPKKHMLSKYVGDIRNMGCIDGYSTQQSEHQHKKDAKSPAKRTNKRYSSVKQMAEFVHRRDLLFDMQAQNSQPRIEKPNLGVQPTTHKLISKLNPSSINELFASHVNVGQFERLIRSFLDTRMEGRNSTRNLSNMPKLDTEIVTRYQTLIIDDYDVDGICVREKVHARENYHGRDRYDYAIFRDGESGHIYGADNGRTWAKSILQRIIHFFGSRSSSQFILFQTSAAANSTAMMHYIAVTL